MRRKTISLPDEMDDFIDSTVKAGEYGNDSEFIRDLVRGEQRRRAAVARFQKLIDEGIASGISDRSVEDIWKEALRRHTAKSEKKRAAPAKKK